MRAILNPLYLCGTYRGFCCIPILDLKSYTIGWLSYKCIDSLWLYRAKLRWHSSALSRNKVLIQIAFFQMTELTCVNENCKPVIENMSSAVVMIMYWGSNHSMWTLFAGVTVVKFPTWSTNNSSVVTNTILYGMQQINANTFMDFNLYLSKIGHYWSSDLQS